MEVKKSPKADLQNKRSIFLLSGLIISMLLIIGLFSWSQKEKVIEQITFDGIAAEIDVADITVQEDKPQQDLKPQPVLISDMLKIVKDNTTVEADMGFLDDVTGDLGAIEVKTFTKKEEAIDEDIPVVHAEEMPSFQGKDINAFRRWCGEHLVYPPIAQDNGIQGRVFISFVVERDGSVSNVKVMRGADRELDAAAVKVVSGSPKWSPGRNRGKPVRFTYNMPIDFILHQ